VVIIKIVIMQAFEVVAKSDYPTSHSKTGTTSNLYLTDLLRNYPLLPITYKIILRSLRLLSWIGLQSRIAVFFGMKKGFARLA
jgi:hypothetical protein